MHIASVKEKKELKREEMREAWWDWMCEERRVVMRSREVAGHVEKSAGMQENEEKEGVAAEVYVVSPCAVFCLLGVAGAAGAEVRWVGLW